MSGLPSPESGSRHDPGRPRRGQVGRGAFQGSGYLVLAPWDPRELVLEPRSFATFLFFWSLGVLSDDDECSSSALTLEHAAFPHFLENKSGQSHIYEQSPGSLIAALEKLLHLQFCILCQQSR